VGRAGHQVAAGTEDGRMAEEAGQPGAGTGYRQLHARKQELRRTGHRLLRERQADVRGAHAERVRAGVAG
jgi:hypothetical protein